MHMIRLKLEPDRRTRRRKAGRDARSEFEVAELDAGKTDTAEVIDPLEVDREQLGRGLGDVKFAARVPAGFAPSGSQVGLKFQPSHVHVYADSRLVEGAQ